VPRAPDPNRKKAYEIYKQHGGNIDLVEIASQLNLPSGTIRGWKAKDKWEQLLNGTFQKDTERSKRKKGGQINNKNTVGHSPSVPLENKNAKKHGLFEKYLPKETLDIVNNMSLDPLDILWDNIQIAYAAIVRAQQIAYVRDTYDAMKNGDFTIPAEERHQNFMKAQARAQSELRSLIKQYDIMLHNNWELASEEQKLRIEKLRVDISKANETNNPESVVQIVDDI